MRTGDAGQSWSQVMAGGITTWRAIHFATANSGWVVGTSGAVAHTTDGATWVGQNSGTTVQLNGVWATSASTAVAVGAGGTVIKTTDGGAT